MEQDAFTLLQTLTESTQKLSDELKTKLPEINYKSLSGFRNILVNNCLGLDLPHISVVIENQLPPLRKVSKNYFKNIVNNHVYKFQSYPINGYHFA